MKNNLRAKLVIERLQAEYGDVECSLDYNDQWQLLVAAILSAQCTDARVNKVTPALFEAFPTPAAVAAASITEIEPYISSCGLYHNKAKAIYNSAVEIVNCYGGILPEDYDALLNLPGVGRKIANLLMGECFGRQAIVVDTHCSRLAKLLGLSKGKNPLQIEKDLVKVVPPDQQIAWGHYMVEHGRRTCVARRPDCGNCCLADICETGQKNLQNSVEIP